ncbi:hypothetical protein ACP4OV_001911 [Aristida adscensionis]
MFSAGVGGMPAMSTSAIVSEAVEGSHVLKVQGYSRIKKLGNDLYIQSERFEVGGHRWFIKYYPDGHGASNAGWISLFLAINPDQSNAAVEASVKFSLIDDQGEPVPSYCKSSSVIRTFTSTNSCWGYLKFMEKKTLEESTHLKDDVFRLRCDIKIWKEIRTEAITQYVVVPPSDMHQQLGRLLSTKNRADVTFEVAGETFHAHSLLLAARSSVFMAELYGPMKENTMANIRVDDMEPRVFKALLEFIYTDMLPEIDNDDMAVMAQHLLVAADRYNLERLKLICEDKLCKFIEISTVATTLTLAEQHGCHGLKHACFKFLKSPSNLKAVMATDGFEHLASSCPSLLKELLANVAT